MSKDCCQRASLLAELVLPRLLRYGGWIVDTLPAPLVNGSVAVGARTVLWLWGSKRRACEQNFAVAFGLSTPSRQLRWWARQSFRSYGRLVVDVLRSVNRPIESLSAAVQLDGQEYLDGVLATGRGVVVVLPHVGTWESALAIVERLPYQALAVVDSGILSKALAASRIRARLTLVEQEHAAHRAVEALRRNWVVILAADLVKDFSAIEVALFGRHTALPAGPAFLAYRTGAGIVPIVAVRAADGHNVIRCYAPIWPERSRPVRVEVQRMTQLIADHFERVIRQHPDQWYPYRPLWREGHST
ncbi:MAG: lysophospholipid acyltransferase family protein [Chloroflexi bacterium]|nr:lysophospholipid acyltransferase family protein [Chloroflexota bacterium]